MSFITHSDGNTLRNMNGTAARSCGCGSWLDHWKNFTGTSVTPRCAVAGCNSQAEVGAHVDLPMVTAQKGLSYIAPMCREHNGKHGESMKSKGGIKLARANVKETCKK